MNDVTFQSWMSEDRLIKLRGAFAADAVRNDLEGRFPTANIQRLRDAGLLGLTVPRQYGGASAGLREVCTVLGALAEGCASSTLILAMQLFKIAALDRSEAWPERVRSEVFSTAINQGALINTLRVEPELGSPTRGGLPATIIRRQQDGWLLTGHKIFSTGAPGLSWMDVWARTDEEPARVGHVLVSARSPGIRILETWNHIGMRATCSHDVVFSEVPVADDFVAVRRPEEWQAPDQTQVAWNAAGMAAIYTGIARAARDWTLEFLRQRVPTSLGKPLATLPRAQEKVGEIEMLVATNARLIGSLAADVDGRSLPTAEESALLKAMAVENAVRAVELAASLAGNHAHARTSAIERHIRDVRSGRVQAPQADAAHVAAGRRLLLSDGA